jgi:hypothetical protein
MHNGPKRARALSVKGIHQGLASVIYGDKEDPRKTEE